MLTKSRHAAAPVVVFRKAQLALFAWLGLGILGIGYAIAVFHVPPNGSQFAAGLIAWPFLYIIWLIGVHSAIHMDSRGVIVDNVIIRHVIPWADLRDICVRNGLYFRLRDGRTISSTSYAASLGAALTGYRYTKNVAAEMQRAREKLTNHASDLAPSPGYSRRVELSPWPPVVMLAVLEMIAALSQLT